jgi:transcriptional regulator
VNFRKIQLVPFLEHTAADGKIYRTRFYNLDAILSIGYRVNYDFRWSGGKLITSMSKRRNDVFLVVYDRPFSYLRVMYDLPEYKDHDPQHILDFMQAHPFAVLCGSGRNRVPVATQVPLLIRQRDDRIFLRGHVMKNTDHHKAFNSNPKVLALFTGPQAYVSASWYTLPRQGSTWNYLSVHASGTMEFLGTDQLIGILRETTGHFENNAHSPASFEHIPQDYIDRMVRAIVGFEIAVTKLAHVFKLSQDKDAQSQASVIERLRQRGEENSQQLADEMVKRKA